MNKKRKILLSLSTLLFVSCGGGGSTEVVQSDDTQLETYLKGETFVMEKGKILTALLDGTTFDIESNPSTGENIITVTNGSVEVE